MPPVAPRCIAAAIVAAALAACGGRDGSREPASAQWRVTPRPAVEIGRGDEDALFQVTSAARLSDGRILVANAGTKQVKLFGAGGEPLATLGRAGAGPGEFRFPLWVGVHRDSIRVWDAALERLTVFDGDGKLARSTSFPSVGGMFPSVVGAFSDGSLLLASGTDQAAAGRAAGAWRGRTRLVRVSAAGQLLDTLATVPSQERYSYRSADGTGLVVEDLPFGRRTVMDVFNDAVLIGTGEDYVIRRMDTAGRVRDVVRTRWTPRAVSSQDVQEYRDRMVTVGGRSRPGEAEAWRSQIPYPRALPPYEQLLLDVGGAIWVKEAQPPREWTAPARWRVYSAGGAPLATIELPARIVPQAIGEDWILCTALDGEDRETVRLYRYSRS